MNFYKYRIRDSLFEIDPFLFIDWYFIEKSSFIIMIFSYAVLYLELSSPKNIQNININN